jgi:hypothetical protein
MRGLRAVNVQKYALMRLGPQSEIRWPRDMGKICLVAPVRWLGASFTSRLYGCCLDQPPDSDVVWIDHLSRMWFVSTTLFPIICKGLILREPSRTYCSIFSPLAQRSQLVRLASILQTPIRVDRQDRFFIKTCMLLQER